MPKCRNAEHRTLNTEGRSWGGARTVTSAERDTADDTDDTDDADELKNEVAADGRG
jgi:hypothetical protein